MAVFVAILLAIACRCPDPEPPSDEVVRATGVRVTVGATDVRLEVPVRTLARPDGLEVVLVGAVHVAEPALYDRIAQALAVCSVVLREGLEPEPDAEPPREDLGPRLAAHGLVRQGDALLDAEGWSRVDLSVAEVRRALSDAGASPALVSDWLDDRDQTALGELLSGSVGDRRGSALVRLAVLRGLAEPPPTAEPEATLYWDIVIGLRDRHVVEHVAGPDPVCVLYGADHLADLEDRLLRRGWRRAGESWVPAIVVPHADLGLGPVQVRQLLGEARGAGPR